MALTEEQLKEIATLGNEAINFTLTDEGAIEFAKAVIAALPKPEAVGYADKWAIESIGTAKLGGEGIGVRKEPVPGDVAIYTEATIAPPASEQKPRATIKKTCVSVELHINGIEVRSWLGCGDWNVEAAQRIADAVNSSATPQPDYKAQRDALLKASEQLLIAVKHLHPCPGTVATMEAANASVKGSA